MLTLQIKEKEIENLTPEEEFVRGTVGAKCQINFDEFWQGYEKYIVFKRVGYEPINIMVDSLENEIEIPYTILAEIGEFKIGVFGITETETLPTLYSKDIKILYGTDTHGTTPPTYTPSEIDQLRLLKQDKLVSGENIKTINGESVLGKGDIKVQIEVDPTYSPTSENAQSGKAVAEAVAVEQKRSDNTFANALKGSKTDTAVLLDDISPVTHDMSVKVRRKNLFNISGISTYDNITNNGDGTITIAANTTSQGHFVTLRKVCNKLQVGDTIVFSLITQSSAKYIYLIKSNRSFVSGNKYVITQDDLDSTIVFYGYKSTDTDYGNPCTISNIQLELGTSATAYTPYVPDLTAVKVSKYGKNLFDISSSRGFESVYGGINSTINGNTLEVVCTVTARNGFLELGTFPKGTYTFSCNKSFEDLSQRIMIGNDILNLKELGSNFLTNTKTFTLSKESKVWVRNSGFNSSASPFIYSNIQLELNSTATDYEPYNSKDDYTPNADGTVNGVTNFYPNTTLLTDTEGVIIDCEYNRDINKAFAELQQTIISLGGNI